MRVAVNRSRLASVGLFTCMVIGIAVITALTVRSRTIIRNGTTTNFSAAASTSNASATSDTRLQGQSETTKLEMERVTITPTGFEPSVIGRGPGRFLLAVDNRSGHDDLTLHLEGQTGRLRAQRASRSKASWREVLELAPGEYLLREANHREWLCRITIAAN